MQQYAHEHCISNLLGSPLGYVGSSDKPSLAKELDKYVKPQQEVEDGTICVVENVVLVFDELEKAHPKI